MDFLAKRRSAKRWRPEELRQEQGGRQTLTEFFDEWWMTHGVVQLKRSTLAVYRCLWETHAQPRLGSLPLRDIDARKVVAFRARAAGSRRRAPLGGEDAVHAAARLPRRRRVRRRGVQPVQGRAEADPWAVAGRPAADASGRRAPGRPPTRSWV
ncbi:hypothetical protein [Paraconexibacter antarcticus]|uniref:hypothetical protein n=1 Tax=Paraconexibacter antarcticus TaxID=2949664 RepID=UPI00345FC83F